MAGLVPAICVFERARKVVDARPSPGMTVESLVSRDQRRLVLGEGVRIVSMRRRVVIAYKIGEHTIDILRVFYGGRDYEAIITGSE